MRDDAATSTAVRREVHAVRGERGSVAVMFIGSLIVIFGFFGLALDLSMLFNRKVEMQNLANVVALAAAAELNGTTLGVTRSLQRASERFVTLPGTVIGGVSYQYSTRTVEWTDAAITFGTTPDGPWLDAGTAAAQPDGLLFVRVDTGNLDPVYGEVQTMFIPVLAPDLRITSTRASAVAGRSAIEVTPIGICAMRPEEARNHKGELEEYGFRRGGAYDLMQLNPESTTAGSNFLINPLVAPGTVGVVPDTNAASVAPFICTGTMAMARVRGGEIVVSSPFPLSDLFHSFNSRFDSYTAPCTPESAPPDTNIKEYKYDSAAPWMTTLPTSQAAAQSLNEGKRWTVLGPDDTPVGTTAAQYGPPLVICEGREVQRLFDECAGTGGRLQHLWYRRLGDAVQSRPSESDKLSVYHSLCTDQRTALQRPKPQRYQRPSRSECSTACMPRHWEPGDDPGHWALLHDGAGQCDHLGGRVRRTVDRTVTWFNREALSMKTYLTIRSRKRGQGAVAVEMAIVLPILITLLTALVFFARVFWYYSVMQKAAHDTTRFLSTATQVEMRQAGAPMAAVARSIADAETSAIRSAGHEMSVDVQCNFATCGFAVPLTVRTVIQVRMQDDIFGPITSLFYGVDGLVLTADVTMRYAGN